MDINMDLVPCNEEARQRLVETLFEVDSAGIINKKAASYVYKTFPSILLDIARLLTEQATKSARELGDQNLIIRHQLKPYLMFELLLGKCPQVTSLMYSYFENSSFQPLSLSYTQVQFTDEILIEILQSYFKYLAFNPGWFSAVWNWSELGRIVTSHPNNDIRYLAACCLSIITRPTRVQHISFLNEVIEDRRELVDLQIKHRHLFNNTFKPCIETKREMGLQFASSMGRAEMGYTYCTDSLTKVANILLLKRNTSKSGEFAEAISDYIPVDALKDVISRIAYSVSISKPCLLRGPCGSGKTAVLDYIAAHTNRLNPPDYVKVQIGDQIDSKLLIGSYVCTEIPGQFEWQPGPLTRAMAYGSWIVFEDIDLAPSDMAQVIHSVIENGNLTCVSSCPIKLDNPHPDFRIFFTQRTRQSRIPESLKLGLGFVERLCDIVDVPELNDNDLKEILDTRFKFNELSQTILQLYNSAKKTMLETNSTRAPRIISLRDLFKFCKRLSVQKMQFSSNKFSSGELELVCLNAIDCFLTSLSSGHFLVGTENLGQVVSISSNDIENLVINRKPEVREESTSFTVGRAKLLFNDKADPTLGSRSALAYTKQSLQLMERVALCIYHREPVLLVGETGVGKTSIVQHLADLMRNKLVVINLSQQSDSSDLLGGYKPVEMRQILVPINDKFEKLFEKTFDKDSNKVFLQHVSNCFSSAKKYTQWVTYLQLVCKLCTKALDKNISRTLLESWNELHDKARRLSKRISAEKDSNSMALSFSEGSLLRAVKEGKWILLDEINLAEPDVLQCLLQILDSTHDDCIYMNNPTEFEDAISIHKNFRIFACMNPSTDVGKRELSVGVRERFSEFFVDDVEDKNDLRLIVESYVKACLSPAQIENIVEFYREIRARSDTYSDISGNSPVYTLRTLCRALTICSNNVCHNMEKSLLESLRITFLQQLNDISIVQVMKLIEQTVFKGRTMSSLIDAPIPMPKDTHKYAEVQGFWVRVSTDEVEVDDKYIVTKSVEKNLQSLSRIISLGQRKLPILIQGNTSVGKTSLIMYLAKLTGNRCYRINNHEHTDLQEYVGRYVLREDGELAFQEGLLVRAMRKGYWIILDELNLAPCELLEALNRVLDDNRELFIPETRETIKANSKFMLFATQNPPEEYAGRKLLSRAFRNRFIELHFDEIPGDELEDILHKRCEMPPQYAKKIVAVMKELQLFRRESGCFNGKNGFMTMRDLFRWGERYASYKKTIPDNQFYDWDAYIAGEGLVLLEGRVRTMNEADIVKSIIEKVFKRELDRQQVYTNECYKSFKLPAEFEHIKFSREFNKLYVQMARALMFNEPVLLCGQTGCGKTTACQLYSAMKSQRLITYNCHLNTESSDFVGGVRPSRQQEDGSSSEQTFPWINGPLVEAMKNGDVFLMDEISLADDAVLERINSVLEPSRSITLTEKDGEEIFANESFRLVATMNPGGDYGKKELSPALRNRFTEIYCHNTTDIDQLKKVIEGCLVCPPRGAKLVFNIVHVMCNFLRDYYRGHDIISIRDIISWCKFINKTTNVAQVRPLTVQEAIVNGASLVFFDQFGTCGHKTLSLNADSQHKAKLRSSLISSVEEKFGIEPVHPSPVPECLTMNQDIVRFKKFCLPKGPLPIYEDIKKEFVIDVPIVRSNLMKIVRAMQLDRPILLEGDPGAGKTSVVSALAKLTGHKLVRINLSEQTDISDLFGSDLPDASSTDDDTPRFCWHDGPLLRAIRESHWVLLDEMNLASQSVLEGLNACFDHRGEIFIPELNKKIIVNRSTTRIFACQNPYSQGAARKGLPQSFINRFTSIFIESHTPNDLILIVKNLYPNLHEDLISNMIEFNSELSSQYHFLGFEFNLRDILYWCDLMSRYVQGNDFKELGLYQPERFVQFVYLDRMRTLGDRAEVSELFERIFGYPVYEPPYRDIRIGERSFIVGRSILSRKIRLPPQLSDVCILKYQMPYIESIAKAIEFNKMPILVGESGVGKRSMVRILAGLTGNQLNIIGANQEMDTVELLGSFEQKSYQREIVDLIDESKSCVTAIINSISQKAAVCKWNECFEQIWTALYATSIRDLRLSKSNMMEAYRFQLSQMKDLLNNIQPMSTSVTDVRCSKLTEKIDKLVHKSHYLSESMYSSGNFEWIDSILVRSMREGTWLMVENANLMNPATLDRLNSLVEPNGNLSLNEKGSGPNGIEVLQPHPDFRLILTMNPDYGELSRAMRNRGIEIFVRSRFYFEDFLMLLNQNGFEPEEKKACMTYCIMQTSYDTHKKITGEEPDECGSLLAYFGLNYISTLTHQVRRGMDVDNVLADLLIAYYSQKGFSEECAEESLKEYILDCMSKYRKTYEVNLFDERYKWRHLMYDLMSLSGGDSIPAMLTRDNAIFFEDFSLQVLKPDEMIENIDIVNTCITVKIFLELSTHADFEYRRGFIHETFSRIESMMRIVNKNIDQLYDDFLPLSSSLAIKSEFAPTDDMHIDSRNSPDTHYHLLSLDYKGTTDCERLQNRWIMSLYRNMLQMIVDLIEERSTTIHGHTSLCSMSEQVRENQMAKEDLIRPVVEIVMDLYDLLNGILREVGDRSFDNQTVAKMLPRLFWINYFICKLKVPHSKLELVAICNQIPMLWALTYDKILKPTIKDCDMYDLNFKNKKFSFRIQHICDFLDTTTAKPGHVEKAYYRKVLNVYASNCKLCETMYRELDKFFTKLIQRYTQRSQALSLGSDNLDTLAASGLVWSNQIYLDTFYDIEDRLLAVEIAKEQLVEEPMRQSEIDQMYEEARQALDLKKLEYKNHENCLLDEQQRKLLNVSQLLNTNRRNNALDQFSPIWQSKFIQTRLAKLLPAQVGDPASYRKLLRRMLKSINGIILSPRYYATLIKYLQRLEERKDSLYESTINNEDVTLVDLADKTNRENADMYSSYLAEYLIENIVLDHQVVGWTKLRVTTSDLPSLAPLISEYSPLVSLVGSYSLDISHLKLNSHCKSTSQLDSMLMYLWRSYVPLKLDSSKDTKDFELAQNLMHLRSRLETKEELINSNQCDGVSNERCKCVEEYIGCRIPTYPKLIQTMSTKIDADDVDSIVKAVKLIYFGYLTYLEFAPIFTLDPSLRSREKLAIYKAELAHIKLDLHFRNTLYYWKTGENLQLNEIDADEAALYPFSTRVLVERRIKLEKSINKLRREHTKRPRSDDGSLYYELRKEVEIQINRYTNSVHTIINELVDYAQCKTSAKLGKFNNLNTKCRMLIRSLERSISRFRSDYSLYTDLTTNFLVGMCFVRQGLRCLYSRLEQKMQIFEYGFHCTVDNYSKNIARIFSFNNFLQGNIESVIKKLEFYPLIDKICPQENASQIQTILLKTVLIQLNHHIAITPSDIHKCFPIVQSIVDKFHTAWVKRKAYLEEQRKKKEELYQYKVSRSTLGTEISFEHQEFLDICARFPTYDHIYQSDSSIPPTSADQENLETEEKLTNLNRSVDLSACIDICKAHYKFIKEASRNLLGQVDSINKQSLTDEGNSSRLPTIDLTQMIRLEAETLYTVTRHCIPTLDRSFDSFSLECHLLQAKQLRDLLLQTKTHERTKPGSLKSSIEILDEEIFDVYHNANAHEALRFREFILKIEIRIDQLREQAKKGFDNHPTLNEILRLIKKIGSFLITDPMMKFITGSHTLLDKLDCWNQHSIPREDKMIHEKEELYDLIKEWRTIEVDSWASSLHKTKRQYIDSTFCDLWFKLYQVFNNPILHIRNFLREKFEDTFKFTEGNEKRLYEGFALFIQLFLEDSTLGDYQIRLDLVFSFAIQTRFASLDNQAPLHNTEGILLEGEENFKLDLELLTTYVYNLYIQYQGLFESVKEKVDYEEGLLTKELSTETRIVCWQGNNLWDMKNNFRISHRKLNKVMNRYLEVLRRRIPGLQPKTRLCDPKKLAELSDKGEQGPSSEQVGLTLTCIQMLVKDVAPLSSPLVKLKSLEKAPRILSKFQQTFDILYESMSKRYIVNISAIEQTIGQHRDTIVNFHSHKVEEVVIQPSDTKETKAEKLKLCRQMQHSKKYCLQTIFKSLQDLGVSYRRGMNNHDAIDRTMLSLEPLRGMIQNQSRLVLKAASALVDDSLIDSCNEQYRNLIASFMLLMGNTTSPDLKVDQIDRIHGLSRDMLLDINMHKKNAALIYKNLMNIQAVTTRLTQLQKADESKVVVYNFVKVHQTVRYFNELVGRAYLAISKLEKLNECCLVAAEIEDEVDKADDDAQLTSVDCTNELPRNEMSVIKELLDEIEEENSLITRNQSDQIKENLLQVRKRIVEVSSELRDMLNYTITNHLYSDDDLDRLDLLYAQFHTSFAQLITSLKEDDIGLTNFQPGTALGSLNMLLFETERELKSKLERSSFKGDDEAINVVQHPNLEKLNIRLQKLIRQTMLAVQGIYKEELSQGEQKLHLSESAKRKLKPFNYIDSCNIRSLLRLDQVAKHSGNCFITLNHGSSATDITPIVTGLTPLLYIYTQDVACYLNIILTSMHLKLIAANELMPFFTDLLSLGFGLPIKASELDEGAEMSTKSKSSEDNTGFGEGKGDTDVSKRLEFESQLDDLKKPNDDNESDKKDDEETVEAHDDGIEMSDDIDAKAEGATGGDNKADEEAKEDEDDEAQDNLDELDKELDTVDQDEGQLDEKLWDDKDEPLGEDDEQDLRDTDIDKGMNPKMDQKDLQAKDDQLADAKSNEKGENDSQTNGDEQDEPAEGVKPQPVVDMNAEDDDDNGGQDEELDLDEEAAQALKDAPNVADQKAEREEEGDDDSMEISVEDNDEGEDAPIDIESTGDDVSKKDADQEDESKKSADDGNDGNKSDGELSRDEDETTDDDKSAPVSQTLIDDSDIDKQLEVAVEQHPRLNDTLEDPIKELESQSIVPTAQSGPDSGTQKMKSKMVGSHTLYDIYEENDDDPLDFDDEVEQDIEQRQQATGEGHKDGSGQVKGPSNSKDLNDDEDEEEHFDLTKEAAEQEDSDSEKKGDKEDGEDSVKRTPKRTLAERDDNKQGEDSKRRKILPNEGDEEAKPSEQDGGKPKQESAEKVKHIGQDTSSAVEVIDLISSSDDEYVDLPDTGATDAETRLQPKESTSKPDRSEQKDRKELSQPAADDADADEAEPGEQADQSADNKKENRGDESLDLMDMASTISSVETGELLDSDDDFVQAEDKDFTTTYNTNLGLLKYISNGPATTLAEREATENSDTHNKNLMERIDNELSKRRAEEHESVDTDRLTSLWLDCTKRTQHLVHELCQQLQIVLQPTKMSKYKGDYKSGKRLNMRKIISYIASHYRKDKIWLRRTKPSKRTYNITIAVDNSSSMSENNCRQMTYQSLALLAKSLSLIEAGSLSVVSFGEQVKCILEFGQPYVDAIGAQWLRSLRFGDRRTCYSQVLKYSCESFAKQAMTSSHAAGLQTPGNQVSQLLVIISDGRNVSSEEEEVKCHLRQLKSMGVLTLFVIIDDLSRNDGKSIVDVKRCIGIGRNVSMINYMELFPFPFYVLLRQLETMPSILGDALRQWFEIVSSNI